MSILFFFARLWTNIVGDGFLCTGTDICLLGKELLKAYITGNMVPTT